MKLKTLLNLSILAFISSSFTVNASNVNNLQTNDQVVEYLQKKFAEKGISTSIRLEGSLDPIKPSRKYKILPVGKEKGLIHRNFITNKISYSYDIYIPSTYKKKTKILVVFPSETQDITTIQQMTGFNEIAEKKGFIVVYPQFLKTNYVHKLKKINSTHYLQEVVRKIEEEYLYSDIFLVSWGEASFNLLDFTCSTNSKIKGIAIVGSSFLQKHTNNNCLYNYPSLFINATSDLIMPYDGRINYNKKEHLLGMDKTIEFLIKQNKLEQMPIKTEIFNQDIDYTRVKKEIYNNNNKPQLINYKIQFAGHIWPGTSIEYDIKKYGRKTGQINASQIITDFIYGSY